jgi:hypothetical protein
MSDPKLLKGGALFRTPEQKAANAAAAANSRTKKLVNRSLVDLNKERTTVKEAINKNKSLHEKFAAYKEGIDYTGEPGSYKPLVADGESDKDPSFFTKRDVKLTQQLEYNKYMTKVGIINGENIWYNNDKRLKEIEEKINELVPSRTYPNGLPSEEPAPAPSAPAPSAPAPSAPSVNIPTKVNQTVLPQSNSTATILAELQKQAIQLASIEKRLAGNKMTDKISDIAAAVKEAVQSSMPGTASGSSDGKNIGKAVTIASNPDVAKAAKKAAEAAREVVTEVLNAAANANANANPKKGGARRTRKAKARKSRSTRRR